MTKYREIIRLAGLGLSVNSAQSATLARTFSHTVTAPSHSGQRGL